MQKAAVKSKTLDMRRRMAVSLKKNYRFATLDFIFIILFINLFAYIFGNKNTIVGVVISVLMGCTMSRDMTNAPFKHFFTMLITMVVMTVSACFVNYLNPYIALIVNFAIAFFILYSYTYEYANNLYFPYILSYLFMVYITPITPQELPNRLLGVLLGCAVVIAYHLVMKRKYARNTVKSCLNELIEIALNVTRNIITDAEKRTIAENTRALVCKISRLAYERRKRLMRVSDASFAVIDTARGIENLILNLISSQNNQTPLYVDSLDEIQKTLFEFKEYINRKITGLTPLIKDDTALDNIEIYNILQYIRAHMLAMYSPEKRKSYHKTVLSYTARLRGVLQFSGVRFVYALRVSLLIALCALAVQLLRLPHGKWLMFTVASVSLPCADDVIPKSVKRFAATVIGGFISLIIYALIPSPIGRTAIMMLSGYIGFYFAGYTGNYACATVGALGGAVYLTHFGWLQIGEIYGIRLMYIAIGIIIALAANLLIFPMKRAKINNGLANKYVKNVELLEKTIGSQNFDTQLYYSLIIQAHLIEETLMNALKTNINPYLDKKVYDCRNRVRSAHRANRSPADKIYEEYQN